MSWGTSYTYEGYLSRVGKNELERKKEDLKKSMIDYGRRLLLMQL